ncbi:DNA-processing protein DprA [Lacimicrobium sp. SS2-24]|uniref:DNA-processing protein DprA n=1 Tax=Lacimicrobium sp. SS2-24 TaxID=2005569 RepID=UPI000B4AF85E|nr:DNA-processing protein DprA [Lacimicrobium sp. SS2-24]
MSQDVKRKQWMILEQMPRFGAATYRALFEQTHGNLLAVFESDDDELRRGGLTTEQIRSLRHPNETWLNDALAWSTQQPEHEIVCFDSDHFPQPLRQLCRPPLVLYVWGDPHCLDATQLAIVGTRNPTVQGRQFAFELAGQLSQVGFTITSGLALGIDGWAHKGVLQQGGKTIAVLGSGLQKLYPKRHVQLAHEIVKQGGCVMTEFAPQQAAMADHFPRRNRIISGMSMGTIVVEGAIRSGSLITARYALEQGKEVFAVPGSVYNPMSKGCHYLIKQGAKLVETVEDIIEEYQNLDIGPLQVNENDAEKNNDNGLASDKLLDSVEYETTPIDVIAKRSGLPLKAVLTELLEYELRGLVITVPGGYIKLRGK